MLDERLANRTNGVGALRRLPHLNQRRHSHLRANPRPRIGAERFVRLPPALRSLMDARQAL